MEDHEIVRAVLGGESGAYRLLVERYQDRVYNLVLKIVRAPADAEEVTSDVFFRAYQKLDAFEFRSQFFTWIYRIAINRASDRLDQKKRERAGSLDDLPAEPGVAAPIDLSHSSCADRAEDLVRTQTNAGSQGHGASLARPAYAASRLRRAGPCPFRGSPPPRGGRSVHATARSRRSSPNSYRTKADGGQALAPCTLAPRTFAPRSCRRGMASSAQHASGQPRQAQGGRESAPRHPDQVEHSHAWCVGGAFRSRDP